LLDSSSNISWLFLWSWAWRPVMESLLVALVRPVGCYREYGGSVSAFMHMFPWWSCAWRLVVLAFGNVGSRTDALCNFVALVMKFGFNVVEKKDRFLCR
jgi:hypothetical protein